MSIYEESLYLRAVQRKPVERTPVWLMRQAGRYLEEYRELRSKYDFLTVCKTPDLATEVTMQPIRRFGFDAAILFSDILVIPEAMGMKLEFLPDHGPKLTPEVRSDAGVEALILDDIETRLEYVAGAIKQISGELDAKTPLIGFSGSPFTLATYMIEGKPTRNFKYIKSMLYQDPELLHKLLSRLTRAVSRYLKMQIEAGAHAVQIFDTWGGVLPPHLFTEFSAAYMEQIVVDLKKTGALCTVFTKGGISTLKALKSSTADMLGVDWQTSMAEAYSVAGDQFALQGNLDPTALYGSKEHIRNEVESILQVFNGRPGHVFNLGHGILPDIPVDNVYHLLECVREISSNLHK